MAATLRAGDARRGAAAPAAHPRAQLHRPAGARRRASTPASRTPAAQRRASSPSSRSRARSPPACSTGPTARGIGFSHFVSLGDSADVDFGDLLDYLASDARTRAILLYVESVKHARKFMSAARAAARNKPVIVVKAGRAPRRRAGAAASHTGALAGSDAVFDAAFRRAGMLRVDTLEELFDAAETLARRAAWRGERLAILTNGGGAGVLAADALAARRRQARRRFAARRSAALDAVLPRPGRTAIRSTSSATRRSQRYADALRSRCSTTPEVDARAVHACADRHRAGGARSPAPACRSCSDARQAGARAAGSAAPRWRGARALFAAAGTAGYDTPERRRARLRCSWSQYRRNQALLLQTPPSSAGELAPMRDGARRVDRRGARRRAATCWTKPRPRQCWRPTAFRWSRRARRRDADEAADAAAAHRLSGRAEDPLAATSRTSRDVGGVALDLAIGDARARRGGAHARQRRAACRPRALAGFTVQPMAHAAARARADRRRRDRPGVRAR